jgi:tetratricopeptide (TPR) repeat protein
MGKIIQLSAKQPSKFGFEKVRKSGKGNPDQSGLFSSGSGQVLRLPTGLSPFEEALLLDECGDSGAEKAYRRAILEGDFVADAYCNLGIIESKAGKVSKAFDSFTKSLEHAPRHFEAHYNLGNLYFEGDNIRLARMHYELAVEINPDFPNLYFNLGLVLALMEETKSSIDALLKYQMLVPQKERGNAEDLINGLRRSLASI